MIRTITKRFDQLAPGDVIHCDGHRRAVVMVAPRTPGACPEVWSVPLGAVEAAKSDTLASATPIQVEAVVDPGAAPALRALLTWAEGQICTHENTHRGGAIWEICDDCGAKWADDQGGKPAFAWPAPILAAREFLEHAPALTLAQAHGEELADRLEWLLGFVETYAREHMGPATPEINKVRNALYVARPIDPPTLAEALEALETLHEGTRAVNVGEWDSASMQVARERAHDVVQRARRAKLIP